jgi:predicted transcriptional regulator
LKKRNDGGDMELDSFLSSPRWDILRVIAEKPSSPMEIAAHINTTISFVSQQLKLLEAAGIVKKTRTGNVDKGKPRTLFSISKETMYVVPLAKGFQEKKLLPLTRERSIILKIWSLEDQKSHVPLERFFWSIEGFLKTIDALFVYTKGLTPKVFILAKDDKLTHQINDTQKRLEEKMPYEVVPSVSALSKLEYESLVPIYDPHRFFQGKSKVKGGIQ